ncbi:hypothetical protein [Rhodococcoides fascians]|uniref:hypothetical protein n=1 Tax=Rhodococcoides fascians TaxID=1828 RepID=UPI0035300E23
MPVAHPMPELGDIDLAANIRILVRAGCVGTAGTSRTLLVRAASIARARSPAGRRIDTF